MPVLEGIFDADDHISDGSQTRTFYGAIPAGDYHAVAIESEIKETKAKTGKYCQFKFIITEGPYANTYLWARLNVVNPNATAQRIGNEQLANFCRAVGKTKIRDTDELLSIPLILTVSSKPRKNQEGSTEQVMVNEIEGYKPRSVKQVARLQAEQQATPF